MEESLYYSSKNKSFFSRQSDRHSCQNLFFPHLQKIEIDPRPINCWEYDMPTCVSRQLWSFQIHTPYLSELDFSNSPVWNIEFDELDFFPSLKYQVPKSQFRNPFHWVRVVKNVISKWTKMKISQVSISLIHSKFELEKISSWFQTGKKIQFIKLDISNWRIGKIQCR